MSLTIPSEAILAEPPQLPAGEEIGTSRDGRAIIGYRLGHGARRLSLIGGCHADEPVGPAMLDLLVSELARRDADDPLLDAYTWYVVPHVNPDGEARNATWTTTHPLGNGDARGYDLGLYLRAAVREQPGDDVEFGFPRSPADYQARPENRAVAAFLAPGAPFVLHASFHGMAFAAGPWFLIEHAWAERTEAMRERLRARVRALGYELHDVDRGGEKGFFRIDEGFTSRPDSRAMAAHFEALGNSAMARRFRPSSMEHVRSLGGDPLTFVSEMPLFLLPAACYEAGNLVRPTALGTLHHLAAQGDAEALAREAAQLGLRPMPIGDQMRLQLAFLEEGLHAVEAQRRKSST